MSLQSSTVANHSAQVKSHLFPGQNQVASLPLSPVYCTPTLFAPSPISPQRGINPLLLHQPSQRQVYAQPMAHRLFPEPTAAQCYPSELSFPLPYPQAQAILTAPLTPRSGPMGVTDTEKRKRRKSKREDQPTTGSHEGPDLLHPFHPIDTLLQPLPQLSTSATNPTTMTHLTPSAASANILPIRPTSPTTPLAEHERTEKPKKRPRMSDADIFHFHQLLVTSHLSPATNLIVATEVPSSGPSSSPARQKKRSRQSAPGRLGAAPNSAASGRSKPTCGDGGRSCTTYMRRKRRKVVISREGRWAGVPKATLTLSVGDAEPARQRRESSNSVRDGSQQASEEGSERQRDSSAVDRGGRQFGEVDVEDPDVTGQADIDRSTSTTSSSSEADAQAVEQSTQPLQSSSSSSGSSQSGGKAPSSSSSGRSDSEIDELLPSSPAIDDMGRKSVSDEEEEEDDDDDGFGSGVDEDEDELQWTPFPQHHQMPTSPPRAKLNPQPASSSPVAQLRAKFKRKHQDGKAQSAEREKQKGKSGRQGNVINNIMEAGRDKISVPEKKERKRKKEGKGQKRQDTAVASTPIQGQMAVSPSTPSQEDGSKDISGLLSSSGKKRKKRESKLGPGWVTRTPMAAS